MTPPRGAAAILQERTCLDFVADRLAERAQSHAKMLAGRGRGTATAGAGAGRRTCWTSGRRSPWNYSQVGAGLQYQSEVGGARPLLYEFLDPELKTLPPRHKKFRANRSMRDVEPSVNLWLRTSTGSMSRRRRSMSRRTTANTARPDPPEPDHHHLRPGRDAGPAEALGAGRRPGSLAAAWATRSSSPGLTDKLKFLLDVPALKLYAPPPDPDDPNGAADRHHRLAVPGVVHRAGRGAGRVDVPRCGRGCWSIARR